MRLERSTWPQVERYFSEHDMVMMLFGSTECHGRHNPMGTDIFEPLKISELVEAKMPDVLMTPIMPFGATNKLVGYPGTLSLGDRLLGEVVRTLTDQLYEYGARRFVFLNGHGGNTKALTEVQIGLSERGCVCALLDWWRMIRDIHPEWAGGHGGAQETSAILYIDESLVDRDAIADDGRIDDLGPEMPTVGFDTVEFEGVKVTVPRHVRSYASNGWMGPDHPERATAEWGERMLGAMADWTCDFLRAFEKVPLPEPFPAHGRIG